MPNLGGAKKPLLIVAAVIVVILVVLLLASSMEGWFNQPIGISWKNNPLDLKQPGVYSAELDLVLVNTTDKLTDIDLSVTTDSSEELIIFCPYTHFTNVAPQNNRSVTCLIRRNPNNNIFSGTYTLTVTTNLGSAQTTLEIKTK